MSAADGGEPVAPQVFDLLDPYIAAVENGEIDVESPVKRRASIAPFLETFFQQFFEAGWNVEVKAIDQTAKVQATRVRLGLDRDTRSKTAKLIASFEELCDLWPDLLGSDYGGPPSELERFHKTYLPRLIRRISEWAQAEGYPQIQKRAEDGSTRLAKAMT
jgi:hypothetical protein